MEKGRREQEQEAGGDRQRETEAQRGLKQGRETKSKRRGKEGEEEHRDTERESTQEIPNHFKCPP